MTVTDFPNATPNFFIGFQGSRKLRSLGVITLGLVMSHLPQIMVLSPLLMIMYSRLTNTGLLLEGNGTNLVIQSEDFANAWAWSKPQRTS